MAIELKICTGAQIAAALETAVEMRIRLFAEFPYLYVGTPEYERDYFAGFQAAPGAMVAQAILDGRFAGLATAIPLEHDEYILKQLGQILTDAKLDPAQLFYLGEVMVEPSFQGRGVGSALLSAVREEGKRRGLDHCCLMAVDRPLDHPSRPRHFGMPVPLWARSGFRALKGRAFFEYPTRLPGGNVATIPNPMVIWRD